MTSTTSRSKKVLAPLAVLLAAGALAVGSGATFTAATTSSIESVTSGTLAMSNDGIKFGESSLLNLKPGDERTGELKLRNTGSLPAEVTLKQSVKEEDFDFENDKLSLTIAELGGKQIWSGPFDKMPNVPLDVLDAGAAKDYSFTVSLASGNENQGKEANASFTWDAIQLDAPSN